MQKKSPPLRLSKRAVFNFLVQIVEKRYETNEKRKKKNPIMTDFNDLFTIFKCFGSIIGQKLRLSQEVHNVLIGIFVLIFFSAILSF